MAVNITEYYKKSIDTLNRIGIALSTEKDRTQLLKTILTGALQITHCDAGTLYLVQGDYLEFSLIANESQGIKPSEIKDTLFEIKSIPLFINNQHNLSNVATCCYHQNDAINIPDAYKDQRYDFSGTKLADAQLHYLSKSFLCIPLHNHEGKVIGILQLINALNDHNEIVTFDESRVLFAKSLASQAAITLTKFELILAQKKLFEALLQLIANAIDAKSHHTSTHCTRVPIITNMIAVALNETDHGPLKDKHLTQDELEELMISAWLHDSGKIIIPDHVVNKSTKLETIMDSIEMINVKIEVLKRDARIACLENKMSEEEYLAEIENLEKIKSFLNHVNIGGEFLSESDIQRIRSLGVNMRYHNGHELIQLLTENEIDNLSIARGTLNQQEREIIQNHAKITYEMLKTLPYPDHLKNVPDIAGAHHERMDGTGYPQGKTAHDLPIQARILAIADIFEALTAPDRPYKTPKPLSEVVAIMTKMKDTGHIDAQLFDLFIKNKIYLEFAKQYLKPEQIDF